MLMWKLAPRSIEYTPVYRSQIPNFLLRLVFLRNFWIFIAFKRIGRKTHFFSWNLKVETCIFLYRTLFLVRKTHSHDAFSRVHGLDLKMHIWAENLTLKFEDKRCIFTVAGIPFSSILASNIPRASSPPDVQGWSIMSPGLWPARSTYQRTGTPATQRGFRTTRTSKTSFTNF